MVFRLLLNTCKLNNKTNTYEKDIFIRNDDGGHHGGFHIMRFRPRLKS